MRPALIALAAMLVALPSFAQDTAEEPPPRAPAGTDITPQIAIPAGTFTMGSEGSDELPLHQVKIDAFLMDKTEVTNAQYQAFCEATDRDLPVFWGIERFRCGPNYPGHPVVGVSQADAEAYAAWVGKRLPTEAEWEYAGRGGLEGLKYDLADTIATDEANTKVSGNDGTMPVASYRPNGYGLHDMVGNVREWTSDRWEKVEVDSDTVLDNPAGPEEGRWIVIKGGGWFSGPGCQSLVVRNVLPRHWKDFNVGFRCAADPVRASAD